MTTTCDQCGRRKANPNAHRDYVHEDNGQRSELFLEDGRTVLAPVCTGHDFDPIDCFTTFGTFSLPKYEEPTR